MTSQDLLSFTFDSKAIRVATDANGTPWFVAKDVAEILGYNQTSDGLAHCRNSVNMPELNRINNLAPATKWIPEADVYRMVMRSNLPKAERFQDWVVEEVLPSIRKTGKYEAAPSNPAQNFNDPIIGALVHGLMEIDTIKQQQAAIVQQQAALDYKTAVITSRLEHVELQHRHGVPDGYLSKSHAHHLYSRGLSEDVFHRAMLACGVTAQNYIHTEDGHETQSVAYLESEIAPAVEVFLRDARQVTRLMCESPMLNGKRFRYIKVNGYEVAA